jgi:hypothetical protein
MTNMETPPSAPSPAPATFTIERRWVFVALAVAVLGALVFFMIGVTKRPPLPVSCTWRNAALDRTKVCVITVTVAHNDPFRMNVRYVNATNGGVRNDTVTAYGTYGTAQLGHLEGFPLLPGDTLEFSHPDFEAVKFTCPTSR